MNKSFYLLSLCLANPSHAQFGQLLSQLESHLRELSNIVEKMPTVEAPQAKPFSLEQLSPTGKKVFQALEKLQQDNPVTKDLLGKVGWLPLVRYPDGKSVIFFIIKGKQTESIFNLGISISQEASELGIPFVAEASSSFINQQFVLGDSNKKKAAQQFTNTLLDQRVTTLVLGNFPYYLKERVNAALFAFSISSDFMTSYIKDFYTQYLPSLESKSPQYQGSYLGRIKVDILKQLLANPSDQEITLALNKALPDGSFENNGTTIKLDRKDPLLSLISCFLRVENNPSQLIDNYFYVCPTEKLLEKQKLTPQPVQPKSFKTEILNKLETLKTAHHLDYSYKKIGFVPLIKDHTGEYALFIQSDNRTITDFTLHLSSGISEDPFMEALKQFIDTASASQFKASPQEKEQLTKGLTTKLYDPIKTHAVVQKLDLEEEQHGVRRGRYIPTVSNTFVTFIMQLDSSDARMLQNVLKSSFKTVYKVPLAGLKETIEEKGSLMRFIVNVQAYPLIGQPGSMFIDPALVKQLDCYFKNQTKDTYLFDCTR